MKVFGGTYLERVYEPYWHELFGSGMRAAAMMSSLSETVRLSTYLSSDEIPVAEAKSEILGFGLTISCRD
ncbi:MAG: hypothetical protein PHN75_12745, partial [Syntrophales bacterium]|nr:hypothetical protein [Syntrophales bacterium]